MTAVDAKLTAPEGVNDPINEERELVNRCLAGDGLAYRQLVAPHMAMLVRVCARASGSFELGQDAVQEALTLTYKRLQSLSPGTPFRAFLAGIAVKRAKTLARSERRRLAREKGYGETQTRRAGTPSPELAYDAEETARAVSQALAHLPKKRRQAVVLRLDANLSDKEIAEALGSSEPSVRVLVHLGLKQLRAALAKEKVL